MDSLKCPHCTLVNFVEAPACRRCGLDLAGVLPGADQPAQPAENPQLTLRFMPVLGTLAFLIVAWWGSLLLSSDGLDPAQRATVQRAVEVLRTGGFDREVFLLEHVTSFRASDNWWNSYVGHGQAYAATNFPFEVMTLYPPFFSRSEDDVERAIILLHEAQHLLGKGEQRALAAVWRAKPRLGWTAARYSHTTVWKNTREWTHAELPRFFACGADFTSDCHE